MKEDKKLYSNADACIPAANGHRPDASGYCCCLLSRDCEMVRSERAESICGVHSDSDEECGKQGRLCFMHMEGEDAGQVRTKLKSLLASLQGFAVVAACEWNGVPGGTLTLIVSVASRRSEPREVWQRLNSLFKAELGLLDGLIGVVVYGPEDEEQTLEILETCGETVVVGSVAGLREALEHSVEEVHEQMGR
jgi:hypothetical protein